MSKKFNLNKSAESPKHYEAYLRENNDKSGLHAETNPGSLDWFLQKQHKDQDPNEPFNSQLESSDKGTQRSGNANAATDKALDISDKLYNMKRSDKLEGTSFNHVSNQIAEAHDQKKDEEFRKAQTPQDDTSFWDTTLGVNPKIKNNVQSSQLQNHHERFKGLDKTMPISESAAENAKRMGEKDKYDKMKLASKLHDADAMIFHIYAQAAQENREITVAERQMLNDINHGKIKTFAQWDDDFGNDFADQYGSYEEYSNDLEDWGNQEAWEDAQAEMMDGAELDVDDEDMYDAEYQAEQAANVPKVVDSYNGYNIEMSPQGKYFAVGQITGNAGGPFDTPEEAKSSIDTRG